MRRPGPAGLLVALSLLAGCASDPVLPADPPADFLLVVDGKQVLDPPCDLTLAFGADGVLRYDVHHRGEKPADRRGTRTPDADAARAVWDALLASGILAWPDALPEEGAAVPGRVVFRLTADGIVKTVAVESGADAGLDAVLAALVAAGPPRLLVPPGSE